MKTRTWKPYVFFVALAEALGALSGLLSRSGMDGYEAIAKSSLTPPAPVFPLVWIVLYALMGLGAARIYLSPPAPMRSKSLLLFALQLGVNFFWSLLFFNLRAFGFSFLWLLLLWVLILLMILFFATIDKKAALLQIPYLLWVSFAGYLNYMIWALN